MLQRRKDAHSSLVRNWTCSLKNLQNSKACFIFVVWYRDHPCSVVGKRGRWNRPVRASNLNQGSYVVNCSEPVGRVIQAPHPSTGSTGARLAWTAGLRPMGSVFSAVVGPRRIHGTSPVCRARSMRASPTTNRASCAMTERIGNSTLTSRPHPAPVGTPMTFSSLGSSLSRRSKTSVSR